MSRCSRLSRAHACLLQQPSEYHGLAIRGRPDASRSHLRELRRRDSPRRQGRSASTMGYRVSFPLRLSSSSPAGAAQVRRLPRRVPMSFPRYGATSRPLCVTSRSAPTTRGHATGRSRYLRAITRRRAAASEMCALSLVSASVLTRAAQWGSVLLGSAARRSHNVCCCHIC